MAILIFILKVIAIMLIADLVKQTAKYIDNMYISLYREVKRLRELIEMKEERK